MPVIKGVVVFRGNQHTSIELENGAITTIPTNSKIGRGAQVEIAYDFTHGKVIDLWEIKDRPVMEEPVGKPVNVKAMGTMSNDFVEEQDLLESRLSGDWSKDLEDEDLPVPGF